MQHSDEGTERANGGEGGFKESGEFGVTLRFLAGVNGKRGNRQRAYHYSWSDLEHNFMTLRK